MVANLKSLVVPIGDIPKPNLSWLDSLGDSIGGAITNARTDASFKGLADRIGGSPVAQPQQSGGFLSRLMGGSQQQASQAPMIAPVGPVDRGPAQGSTYQPFIDTIKTKVTNPYGLAAVAATGRAESGWSPDKANGSWSDPSQRGASGTSGGILSWRNERLQGLYNYASQKGEQPGNISPQTQAEYFLQEDPNLVAALNNAKSPQEAQNLMNNAWKFAGYDQPGGETARRMALAQNYYAQDFRNREGVDSSGAPYVPSSAPSAPVDPNARNALMGQVASLDPSIGMPMPGATGQMRAGDPSQVIQAPASTPVAAAPSQTPAAGPVAQAPMQAPAAAPQNNIIAQGITPVARGSVDPSLIQYMLRDRNLRETGLKLWAANAQGQNPTEAWQFINLPDGTLARANQQTGQVERLGQFAKQQEPDRGVSNVNGTLVRNADGSVVYKGEGKPPELTDIYDDQTGQPYKARYNAQTGQYERVGGVKAPNGMSIQTNPDGTVSIQQGAAGKPPKLTEAEGKNSGFLVRANASQETLNSLEDQGASLWNNTAGKVPVVGNFLRSQDAQKYDQAKRDFINAQLRRESGAVISPDEFGNAEQQYFPQPGDGPEVIAQKRVNRQNAIRGLEIGSGAGADLAKPPQSNAPRRTSTGVEWSIEE